MRVYTLFVRISVAALLRCVAASFGEKQGVFVRLREGYENSANGPPLREGTWLAGRLKHKCMGNPGMLADLTPLLEQVAGKGISDSTLVTGGAVAKPMQPQLTYHQNGKLTKPLGKKHTRKVTNAYEAAKPDAGCEMDIFLALKKHPNEVYPYPDTISSIDFKRDYCGKHLRHWDLCKLPEKAIKRMPAYDEDVMMVMYNAYISNQGGTQWCGVTAGAVGTLVDTTVGTVVGAAVGAEVGASVDPDVGATVGAAVVEMDKVATAQGYCADCYGHFPSVILPNVLRMVLLVPDDVKILVPATKVWPSHAPPPSSTY
jgi:hypothetical protein